MTATEHSTETVHCMRTRLLLKYLMTLPFACVNGIFTTVCVCVSSKTLIAEQKIQTCPFFSVRKRHFLLTLIHAVVPCTVSFAHALEVEDNWSAEMNKVVHM